LSISKYSTPFNEPFALIIEDDKGCADLFGHILEFVGYSTEIIDEGQPALARLEEVIPDIILLDLNLPPGPSGADILHFIRNHQALADTPVLIVTAYPHIADEIQDEADLVLIKPVSVGQLRNLVSRFYPYEISKQLMQDATIDPVTNLPNRALLLDRLGSAIERAKRNPSYKFALLKVDFTKSPYFMQRPSRRKEEKLLNKITNKLRRSLRKTDTIARIDRYEFAVLLDAISDYDDAIIVAKKIQTDFLLPIEIGEEQLDLIGEFSYAISKDIYEEPEGYLNGVLPIQLQVE
jgi:diguanylate cyclase (GGDEF)-like protein